MYFFSQILSDGDKLSIINYMGMMYIPELNKLPFHKAKWFERLRRVQVAAIVHSDGTHIDEATVTQPVMCGSFLGCNDMVGCGGLIEGAGFEFQ